MQPIIHSFACSFLCFFNRLISCHLFHQFRLFSVHSNHSVCSIPVFPLALPFVHSLVRSNSCYFNSTQVCTRSFHAISRPFMLDSFIQSFSRLWILSCYWFHLLSWHLVGISKTTWIFHCFCISHTCCSEERCQFSFCAANHAHSPSEAFKGWFGCLRSFLYHICIDSPFFRRYSILAYLTGFLNRFGTVAWCSHKGA